MRTHLIGLLLGVCACSGVFGDARAPGSEDEARLEPGMPITADERRLLVADVSALRGLAVRQPIPIEAVSQSELDSGFRAGSSSLSLGMGATKDEDVDALLTRNLAGYYEPASRRVVVRSSGSSSRAVSMPWRMSLAHEIQHALQHQHFGPSYEIGESADERLARRALREGDAELTGRLYVAGLRAQARSRALRQLVERRGGEMLVAAAGDNRRQAEIDVRVWFPYVSGAAFAADLMRAHGFGLVDLAHQQPPTTTEQVLHPNKYLAGEQAVEVAPPPTPATHHSVRVTRLGELGAQLLLSRCNDAEQARAAAAGWGGDSYRLLADAEGQPAELWSTMWDSAADAREVERALAGPACWERQPRPALVVRRGRRLVAVVGFAKLASRRLASSMLAAPVERAEDDPIGPWRVPNLEPTVAREPGTVDGASYHSSWLGIHALLPAGAEATVDREAGASAPLELTVRTDDGGVGTLFVWEHAPTPEQTAAIVDHFKASLRSGGYRLRHVATEAVAEPLGGGTSLSYEGSSHAMRLVLVPLCDHAATLVIARIVPKWSVPHPLDDWMATIRWQDSQRPPMCSWLDPR